MKRRPINKDKYGISKHRYLEVIHHCLQYPEWREELENMTDTVKAIQYGQEGKGSPSQASATERLAIKRAELQEKCKRIEQTAIEADADIYQWLLEGLPQIMRLTYTFGMPKGSRAGIRNITEQGGNFTG